MEKMDSRTACTRCYEETGSLYECCGQVVCDTCYEAEAFDRTTATDPLCEECCLRFVVERKDDEADVPQEQHAPNPKKQKSAVVDISVPPRALHSGSPLRLLSTPSHLGTDECGVCANPCYGLDHEFTTWGVIKSVSAGHDASTPQLVCTVCSFIICVDCAPAQYDLCNATTSFGVKRSMTPACHACNVNDLSGPIKCKDVLEK